MRQRPATIRPSFLWTLFVLFGLSFTSPAAHADYAVLRNGQRLHITGYQRTQDTVLLHFPGGSATLPAEELLSIEPEDTFPASATPQLEMPFGEQIRAAASAYDVDPSLIVNVIAVESNFNPRAVSRKDARGLMQLLPQTAARLAVQNVFDPLQNINAGTRYLKELLNRYHQNLVLALAAYNAGPEMVDHYHGIPPFPETQKYVRRITDGLRSHDDPAWDALFSNVSF